MRHDEASGFSAIELLITLFIAFLFVMMGYQLYAATISDGASTALKAKANNIAYSQLRLSQETAVSVACAATPQVTTTSVDNGNGTQTVTITCPNSTTLPNLRLVTVKVVDGKQEATHAVYVGP